ncbi:Yos1-like protein [Mrakia frigida]|uniref:Yos1p n=1 Tax=Mrakia frigida TaxID=29902 RepID=UPI003FCBFFB1
MGFGLFDLLWASLLFINAIAILNEERFLARIGLSPSSLSSSSQPINQYDSYGGVTGDPIGGGGGGNVGGGQGLKPRLINLIGAVRTLMRIPLIMINMVIIVYELALG